MYLSFYLNRIILFFCIGNFIACATIKRNFPLDSEVSTASQISNPVKLSLSQGYIAGSTLNLRVQLEVLNELETNSVVVQLKGLKNGVVGEVQSLPLASIVRRPIVQNGNQFILPFTLSTLDIDRFAISCSWGGAGAQIASQLRIDSEDQKQILPTKVEKTLESLPVLITDIIVTQEDNGCKKNDCPIKLNLSGKIRKGLRYKDVREVSLAYRLVWLPDGHLPENILNSEDLLPDEKLLPFGNESIPETGFDFQVKGDKYLPQVPGGKFTPVVRVFKFKVKSESSGLN